jgi:hypothetical protein
VRPPAKQRTTSGISGGARGPTRDADETDQRRLAVPRLDLLWEDEQRQPALPDLGGERDVLRSFRAQVDGNIGAERMSDHTS